MQQSCEFRYGWKRYGRFLVDHFSYVFFGFGLPIIFIIFYFERVHKSLEKVKIKNPREVIVKEVDGAVYLLSRTNAEHRFVLSKLRWT